MALERLPAMPPSPACTRELFEPGSRASGQSSLWALWASGGLAGVLSWLSVCERAGLGLTETGGDRGQRLWEPPHPPPNCCHPPWPLQTPSTW